MKKITEKLLKKHRLRLLDIDFFLTILMMIVMVVASMMFFFMK